MTESFRLGTIGGVRVGVNWSVLVIFALVWFSLSAGSLPRQFPGRSTGALVAAGGAAAVVFFVSLLAHELAHAFLARRNGLEVEGITLWLFGGVARLSGEAADPGADFRIAGVGPATSLVLAAAFYAATFVATGLAAGVLAWLAAINAALAVFNLMPAAPLDGGRVLRALLWRYRGDRLSATVTAARAGKGFGILLIGLGIVSFAFGAGFSGLWLAFIGWFLTGAANAEENFARLRGALSDITVDQVMTPQPMSAPASVTIQTLLDDHILAQRHSTFPLVEDERAVGLITLAQVKGVPRQDRRRVRAREIACSLDEVTTAHPGQPLSEVLPRTRGCGDGRILVLADGEVAGIISPSDIAHVLRTSELRDPRDAEHI